MLPRPMVMEVMMMYRGTPADPTVTRMESKVELKVEAVHEFGSEFRDIEGGSRYERVKAQLRYRRCSGSYRDKLNRWRMF